ncbi:1-phosphofructokinase [Ruminococcus sp. OA3]|uniref:1-phosphofructokinase n=1 Tax=Ruminococcus sp. OA3 TaxID=2914164 RepID=UPI001F06B00F|nr:1-phosphofructokinase [Ruminococcus sp. OA3]MCH1983829.1 1-phosphofructokinase [Ruminococcus sp. OA3]
MIYTLTCNPSLDYIVTAKNFTIGGMNRTENERILPGGKGINVSIVLKNLGIPSTILGFTAGFTGEEIRKRVREAGCAEELISVSQGWSRINVKLRSSSESEINGQGPPISSDAVAALLKRLEMLEEGDVLVLAGSIPNSMPHTIYRDITRRMSEKNVMVIVDAAKDLLVSVLQYQPFLIKPNHHELSEIFREDLQGPKDIVRCARKLQKYGARNVLVSMAEAGAILVSETEGVFIGSAPRGKVVNSVGAGDSMVAGFLAGYFSDGSYRKSLEMGIAAGSASAFSEELASREEIEALLCGIKASGGLWSRTDALCATRSRYAGAYLKNEEKRYADRRQNGRDRTGG